MKKFFISAAVLLATLTMNAQLVNVGSIDRMEGVTAQSAVISPDGQFVVISTPSGLEKVSVSDGAKSTVAKGSGLFNVAISADGSKVAFTRPSVDKKHLRHLSVEAVDLASGKSTTVVKKTRQLNGGITFNGNTLNAVNKGKAQIKSLDGSKAQKGAYATINYGHLDVTVDGKTTTIDPQGRGSYIWPSVSPDGTRVCYWLVGAGCFTCNLDGSDVKSHGPLRDAVWMGNNMLIGVDEVEGQNQQLEAASIVALDVNTNAVQKLTDDNVIALDPTAAADGSRVAFTSNGGDVYIININK